MYCNKCYIKGSIVTINNICINLKNQLKEYYSTKKIVSVLINLWEELLCQFTLSFYNENVKMHQLK